MANLTMRPDYVSMSATARRRWACGSRCPVP